MKVETEKLDLVEHFSRLLEEKDIELGFLQKSARVSSCVLHTVTCYALGCSIRVLRSALRIGCCVLRALQVATA